MLKLYEVELHSRLILGTSRFPSPAVLVEAVKASRADVVTVSLRRESSGERAGQGFWSIVRDLGVRVLPNTAGCRSVKEAVSGRPVGWRGVESEMPPSPPKSPPEPAPVEGN